MDARERKRLQEVADDAARTIYQSLNDALADARTNLFDARLKSDVGGQQLIKLREEELEQAKERLRAWATANPSAGYHRRFAQQNDLRHLD